MMIESVVILLIAWSNVLGTQYLLPTKQTKAYTTSVILGAIVNLVINIPLILLWGAVGTAIATVISELVVTLCQLKVVREQVQFRKLFQGTGKYLSAGIMMFVVVTLFNKQLPSSWISLFLEVVIGIVVYGLMLVVFKAKIIDEAKEFFNDR